MNETFKKLTEIIHSRRAVYPMNYISGEIDNQLIEAILENARWAPTHKKTQPWRYVVITGKSLVNLSEYLSDYYKKSTPQNEFSDIKWKKAGERPLQSACVIAICIERSPETVIPAWEETAAVACSVQNLWLSASALGIGSYWSTPGAIQGINDFLSLTENQSCLGLFYMGWMKKEIELKSDRKPISEFTRWLN